MFWYLGIFTWNISKCFKTSCYWDYNSFLSIIDWVQSIIGSESLFTIMFRVLYFRLESLLASEYSKSTFLGRQVLILSKPFFGKKWPILNSVFLKLWPPYNEAHTMRLIVWISKSMIFMWNCGFIETLFRSSWNTKSISSKSLFDYEIPILQILPEFQKSLKN